MAHALAPRLAAPADEHAPRDDGGEGQRLDDEERQLRQRVVVGLHGAEDRKHRELQSRDQERQLPAAVGGDGEQDDQAGNARGGREGHDRHRGQTEAERPAPPPPQGEAERRATNHIEDKQGPVQPAADLVSQRQAAYRGRQQKQRAVDDPVAPRAARRRLLVLRRDDEQGRQETASGHSAKSRGLGRPWTPFRSRSDHRLSSVQASPYGRLPSPASQPIVSSVNGAGNRPAADESEELRPHSQTTNSTGGCKWQRLKFKDSQNASAT